MTYVAEAGHWYDQDGNPAYEVPNKSKGGMRPTRITDAKKLNLVPSVTGILKILDKPALTRWKVNQVLQACIDTPYSPSEDAGAYQSQIMEVALGSDATGRDRGTEIHAAVEVSCKAGYKTEHELELMGRYDEWVAAVTNELRLIIDSPNWSVEKSFSSPLGYGGKIDLQHEDRPIFVDVKTKDFSKGTPKVYEEHAMQLAAYGVGILGQIYYRDAEYYNIFIDRDKPDVVVIKHDLGAIERGWRMFSLCLELWKLQKNFDPSFRD